LHKPIREITPHTIIIDPISSLITIGSKGEVRAMLARLMDMLKMHHITSLFTSLNDEESLNYSGISEEAISSLVDTWIKMRNEEILGNRIRSLYIVKSRGMGHSSEIRDFIVADRGIKIMDADPLKKHSRRTAEKAEAFSGNGVKHKP
jgi:circadian clock protein KaiC